MPRWKGGRSRRAKPMSMVMPRAFSSGRRSQSMPVRALTSDVLPWSMWPAVPRIRSRAMSAGFLVRDEILAALSQILSREQEGERFRLEEGAAPDEDVVPLLGTDSRAE